MPNGSLKKRKRTAPEEARRDRPSLEGRFGHEPTDLRQFRNRHLYRSIARLLREYNRRLVANLRDLGFADFSPAFPQILSNLDTEGTRVGTLARRAGITRQAAGKLVIEIETCGYAERRVDEKDARATLVVFTPRGRKLLAHCLELLEGFDADFATTLGPDEYRRVQAGLFHLAEMFDPQGGLDASDAK